MSFLIHFRAPRATGFMRYDAPGEFGPDDADLVGRALNDLLGIPDIIPVVDELFAAVVSGGDAKTADLPFGGILTIASIDD